MDENRAEETALTPQEMPVGLDHNILNKLNDYEDYLSFYIQLEEASGAVAWLRADMLYQMVQQLGENSLNQLAQDLKQPRSTVINYVRVARAFPMEKRQAIVPFSAHFQASFADSYDEKSGTFKSDTRFQWVEKVAADGLSTRALQKEIKEQKLLDSGVAPETAAKRADIDTKVSTLMHYLGALRDKANEGDEEAYTRIVGIYTTVYGEQRT